ncbi:MAG TPA: hypothetical protein VGW11_00815 [Solirubrobacteraceae bacterium]|nr:hypothetical protein [Solirubrobacteraceae bacterium]
MSPLLAVPLSVLLIVSIAWTFFGPPPRSRASSGVVAALAGLGATAYAVGILLAQHSVTAAAIAMAVGVEGLCAAGWLGRGGGGGGGGGPRRDPGSEPPSSDGPDLDWEEFDRVRGDWEPVPREPTPL